MRKTWKQRVQSVLLGAVMGWAIPAMALGQATLLPNAKQQYLDDSANPVANGQVFYYIPSTSTKKNIWLDAGKTTLSTNPVILDAAGRPQPTGQTFGDGTYRQKVVDANSITIWDAVTTSTGSSSSGGGGTATGDGDLVGTIKPWAGLAAPSQYLFAYGQAVSRTTYPETLTAVTQVLSAICTSGLNVISGLSDTTQVPIGASVEASCLPPGATVTGKASTSLTLSANASVSTAITATVFPFGNGNGSTTFNLPDLRGSVVAGRDNMGGATRGVLGAPYFPIAGLGAASVSQTQTLISSNLPAYTPAGTVVVTNGAITTSSNQSGLGAGAAITTGGGGAVSPAAQTVTSTQATSTAAFTGTPQGGTATAFGVIQPTISLNYIIKVTPDANSSTASGVTSLGGMTGSIACGTNITCTGNIISISGGFTVTSDNVLYTAPFTGSVVQSQTNYNMQRISVTDFAVVGNGTADDTTKIQAAITAAQVDGKAVFFPAPSICYKITVSLVITAPATLLGEQGLGSKICAVDTNAITVNYVSGYGNVTIDGLYLEGSGATAARTAINFPGTTSTADPLFGVTIRNMLVNNFSLGVNARTVWNMLIDNSWFENMDAGVRFIGQVNNANITNTKFVKAAGGGGFLTSVGFELDSFAYSVGGTVGPESVHLIGNKIYGFTTGALLTTANYVVLNETDISATGVGVQFSTIQNGLQIKNSYVESNGAAATTGIYGTGLGSTIAAQINIEGSSIVGTGVVTSNGIQINGPANQNQNNVNIVRNYFSGHTNTDVLLNNPGATNVENNRCNSSGVPTNSISVGTRTSGTVTVTKNVCLKDIVAVTASDVTSGFVRFCDNTVNGTTAQACTWGVTTNSTTASRLMIGGGPGVQPTAAAAGTVNQVLHGGGNTFSAVANADLANSTISGVSLGSNLGTLTFGAHLITGGASYNGSAGVTITSDATAANTASTIMLRDGSGQVAATTFTGALAGNATSATTATTATTATNATNGATVATSTNASFFPLFAASSTNSNQPFNLDTNFIYNPSTDTLTAINFAGNVNGTVGGVTPASMTATTAIANSFVPNSATVPTDGLYKPATGLGWAIGSAAEMLLTATALSPAVDGGNSLGTTALGWQNLFGNTGFVLNIENGDWVATHTTGILTVGTGDLRVTTAGTNAASAVTVGGTQTLTNKTFVTPALGTIASGVATNLTGTAAGLTAGNVTTNANLTGPITSSGNATAVASQTGTGTQFVMSGGTPVVANLTVTSAFTAGGDGSTMTIGPGGSGAVNSTIVFQGSSGTGVGARFIFQSGGVNKWFFGDDASISGSGTSRDLDFYNNSTVVVSLKLSIVDDSAKFASTVQATSGTVGAINTLGGIGVTKDAWIGGNVIGNGAFISKGTVPVGTTGSCVASSFTGGAAAGKFSAAVCVAGTIILSSLPTAPNGYSCDAQDQTTPGNTLKQSANTTTSATFTATTTALDVIAFKCTAW